MSGNGGGGGGVTVRVARPDDAARIGELLAGGVLGSASGESAGDRTSYRDALDEIASTTDNDVWVAEVGGDVVGMCQLIVFRHVQQGGGRCAEIESMHVDERYRSHRIGSALLSAVIEVARRRGCYRVQLTSNKARADAHRFYLRHGFEESHEGFKLYL